jgi:hypothetical protein
MCMPYTVKTPTTSLLCLHISRGIAPSSLSTWRLNEFSWDIEKLLEDLRKLYKEDMLKDDGDLVMLSA